MVLFFVRSEVIKQIPVVGELLFILSSSIRFVDRYVWFLSVLLALVDVGKEDNHTTDFFRSSSTRDLRV